MMGGCWVTKRGVDLIFFVFTDGSKRKGKKMLLFFCAARSIVHASKQKCRV